MVLECIDFHIRRRRKGHLGTADRADHDRGTIRLASDLHPFPFDRSRSATISTVFVLSGCGALLGASITYARFVTQLIVFVNPQNHPHFVVASAIAGAVLGGVFGFCLWRFDVAYPAREPEAAT